MSVEAESRVRPGAHPFHRTLVPGGPAFMNYPQTWLSLYPPSCWRAGLCMWKSSPSPQAHNCFQALHPTQLPAEAAKSVVLGLPCNSPENLRTGRKAVRFCRVGICRGALRAPGLGLPIVSRYACDLWGAPQAQGLPKGGSSGFSFPAVPF